MDVVVSELPLNENVNRIKSKLKKLCDPFAGKVVSVQCQFAILRFPNKDSALRATKHMNGEDVCGSKIKVLYSSQIEISPGERQGQPPQQLLLTSNSMCSSSMDPSLATATNFRKRSKFKQRSASSGGEMTIDLSSLKREVAALLQDVPLGQSLPLFKFREMFERRYRRSVPCFDLYRIRDVVNITEAGNGSRNISLCQEWMQKDDTNQLNLFCQLHPPKWRRDKNNNRLMMVGWAEKEIVTSSLPSVMIDLKTLSARVYSLLKNHNNAVLPLFSFLDCYENSFGEIQVVTEDGVPLEHLISCVTDIEITVGENGFKQIRYCEKKANNEADVNNWTGMASPADALQLAQYSRELVDLLKTFQRCCIPFSKLIPAYHHHFGRQCRVGDYGHSSLTSLLKTLPGTVQILGENPDKLVTLAHRAQIKRFATDVLRMLKNFKEIRVQDFGDAFTQVFPTRNFRPQDYGLCYFRDLVEQLVHHSALVCVAVDEEGFEVLTVPRREQSAEEVQRTRDFATEVFDLLRHSIRCELPVSKFIPAYHHHFGRQCRVADYGFTKLAELFEAIPDVAVPVSPNSASPTCESLEDKILRLVPKEQLKVVGEQIMDLIGRRARAGERTCLDDLEDLFLHEYGFLLRPDLCEAEGLRDLIEQKLTHLVRVDKGIVELAEGARWELVVQNVRNILENQPDCKMELEMFLNLYKIRFHLDLHVSTITSQLCHIVELEQKQQKWIISLTPMRIFTREATMLLQDYEGVLLFEAFGLAYCQKYGRQLRPAHLGFDSLESVFQTIPANLITVREDSLGRRFVFLIKNNNNIAPLLLESAPALYGSGIMCNNGLELDTGAYFDGWSKSQVSPPPSPPPPPINFWACQQQQQPLSQATINNDYLISNFGHNYGQFYGTLQEEEQCQSSEPPQQRRSASLAQFPNLMLAEQIRMANSFQRLRIVGEE